MCFFFRLHPQNVLGVRSFADQYMCSGLVESANKYLQKHFKDVVRTEEFLALKMADVIDILGRDELNVHSEEQVIDLNLRHIVGYKTYFGFSCSTQLSWGSVVAQW